MRARVLTAWAVPALACLAGCAAATDQAMIAPTAEVRQERWVFDDIQGQLLSTAHYRIFTTIDDPEVRQGIAQVLEAAYTQYANLAPALAPADTRPLDCYLFNMRDEWAAYTQQHAGDDAPIYLQISRGGYTSNDVFVSYFIGDTGTYRVAAHEGWHQFVSRYSRQRVPPFLEEGLACTFESISFDGQNLTCKRTENYNRLRALREVIDEGRLQPLGELIPLHAGQIVDRPLSGIDAFYAQSWALARFLLEGEGGRYRVGLQTMLGDAAAGKLYPRSTTAPAGNTLWNPALARPTLERYLGVDLDELDRQYRAYAREIVRAGRPFRRGMS